MNECILVVDDDPEIVNAIAITLEREGWQVRRAYDGLQAVEACLDPAVKLILIDVMMPKLDGLSALLRIRERRNLPVIVLSAKSEDTDKILGLSMGADDYVTKPYNPQELIARVRSQLRRDTSLGDVNADEFVVNDATYAAALGDAAQTVKPSGSDESIIEKRGYDPLGQDSQGVLDSNVIKFRTADVNNDRDINDIDANALHSALESIRQFYEPCEYSNLPEPSAGGGGSR